MSRTPDEKPAPPAGAAPPPPGDDDCDPDVGPAGAPPADEDLADDFDDHEDGDEEITDEHDIPYADESAAAADFTGTPAPAAARDAEGSPAAQPAPHEAPPADPLAALRAADIRNLVLSMLALLAIGTGVFLVASDFLTAWDGRVISARPAQTGEAPKFYEVLIMDEQKATRVETWPTSVVKRVDVPLDTMLLVPSALPQNAPKTTKKTFALYYLVEGEDGSNIAPGTTSPGAFGFGVLVALLGFAVRNMVVTGSPIEIMPIREAGTHGGHLAAGTAMPRPLPSTMPPMPGSAAPGPSAPKGLRSKQGPPPPKKYRKKSKK